MGYDSFRSRHQQNVDRYYAKSLLMFDWWKKIQGTDVVLIRSKEESKFKDFFGSMAHSDSIDDDNTENSKVRLLINHNEVYELWYGGIQSSMIVDREGILERGDLIRYSSGKQVFTFKVTEHRVYGDSASIYREYQIESTKENTL